MKQILQFLRTTLAGGLLFLAPLVVLLIIIDRALALAHKLVEPMAAHIPIESVGGVRMERLLAVGAILLFCFLAGCIARLALARKMMSWIESTVLINVPGYEFFKRTAESLLGVEKHQQWNVVLAYVDDCRRIGFLVERLENGMLTVFLPDAPDGHHGEVLFIASDRVTPLEVSTTTALKCLKRLGAGSGAMLDRLNYGQHSTKNLPIILLAIYFAAICQCARGNVTDFSFIPLKLDVDQEVATQPGESDQDTQDLAKKLSNPVSNLISVPFQFNGDFGIGPQNAGLMTLNIQPVVPITLTDQWNVIVRTILPVKYAGSTSVGVSSAFGLGDITQSFFFSPSQSSLIWGVGPVLLWPTGTDDQLGQGKWGAGPTGVLLVQKGPWTYGILANHIWSYAGDSNRASVNATFLQPFVAYNTPTATTFTINTESTYDWMGHQWTVPINAGVSQLLKLGKLPVQVGIFGRVYAHRPPGGPDWGVRMVFTLLLPK